MCAQEGSPQRQTVASTSVASRTLESRGVVAGTCVLLQARVCGIVSVAVCLWQYAYCSVYCSACVCSLRKGQLCHSVSLALLGMMQMVRIPIQHNPPKNGEIALQTPRTSRLLDCQYSYFTKRPADETLIILLVQIS